MPKADDKTTSKPIAKKTPNKPRPLWAVAEATVIKNPSPCVPA